ncbi:MAG: hypothetical protein ACR2LC_16735 [Pyrinomonadaceae bacterium]
MNYYEAIKAEAKQRRCKVTDLIALAPQNDPFYVGTPGSMALAQWFAELWERFGYSTGVHLRRVHYQIVSQDQPVMLPNGEPYENTERCWDTLVQASGYARNLDLVDPDAFVDRRNPSAIINTPEALAAPSVFVRDELSEGLPELPPFPDTPQYYMSGFEGVQPFHLEIWCEKSTMNDILLPLCGEYQANLVTGLGELSSTACRAVVNRVVESEKPARIFYISDFDPAGKCMPVSVARKIEFNILKDRPNVDMRVFPLMLSAEQVRLFRLPRTPIKETERRRSAFEKRHGSGAVELDALQALQPGAFERIVREAVERYYDTDLTERVGDARRAFEEYATNTWQAVINQYADQIDALESEYNLIRDEFSARMASHNERLTSLWTAIQGGLEKEKPFLSVQQIPEAADAREFGGGLYNSSREYFTQIGFYKNFQGKESIEEAA